MEEVTNALDTMIEHMDDVERLEFAVEIVRGARAHFFRELIASSKTGASPEQLASLKALKENFDAEYRLLIGGHIPPDIHTAAIERAITEHRIFLKKYVERLTPKNNIGGLNGGPS